jgi:hypothetical protein
MSSKTTMLNIYDLRKCRSIEKPFPSKIKLLSMFLYLYTQSDQSEHFNE